MSTAARVRLAASVCTVAALAAVLLAGWGSPAWWAPPAVAVGVAVSELAVVHLRIGRQAWTFSLTESVVGAALACAVGGWVVVAVAAGVAVAQRVRRRPALKLQYNVAQFALAAAGAQLVAGALDGGVRGAVAGLAVFWVLNYALVLLVVAITSQDRLRAMVGASALASALHTTANSSVGLLAAHLALETPVGLLGLLVPLVLLWSSYDEQARRSGEARLFAELARGQERASSRSTDVSAQVVLTAAARLFGGAEVEMVLRAPEGPVLYVGDEQQVAPRVRVDQDVFDEPWVLRALGEHGVSAGLEDGRPWCSAVLGDAEAPLAVLVARRPAGAAPFDRHDQGLARVLAGQAQAWLSVSDLSARHAAVAEQAAAAGGAARALGDLGAQTTPALTVLRDSAARLARLADDAGGVDAIVDELHLVERAVASLLGAVALAAEPDLVFAAPAAGALPVQRRPADDWTTTGVLR